MLLNTGELRRVLFGLSSTVISFFALVALPSTSGATIITIDPSNYEEGTDLSQISPFVTLQATNGSYGFSAITVKRSEFSGGLSFGTFSLGWTQCADRFECAQGFGMTFDQAPQWVSLSVTFTDIVLSSTASLSWFAFDETGDLLGTGFEDTDGYQPGQLFGWNIAVPGMMSLVIGGGDYPSAGDFDRMSFAVGVPVSSALMLSVLGLVGIVLVRCRVAGFKRLRHIILTR